MAKRNVAVKKYVVRLSEDERHIGGRFDHVLVDEYQNTNRLQSSILVVLKPDGRGLTVVGDDAQSIYSFRTATVRNILDFLVGPARRPRSSRSIAIIVRRSRFSRPPIASSTWRPSASPRISGRTGIRPNARTWSASATKPTRSATLSNASWRTARRSQIPGGGPHQRHAGAAAFRREAARSRRRIPGDAADARCWIDLQRVLDDMTEAADPIDIRQHRGFNIDLRFRASFLACVLYLRLIFYDSSICFDHRCRANAPP
jgi:UvrD/REP helicase N-terminal domain